MTFRYVKFSVFKSKLFTVSLSPPSVLILTISGALLKLEPPLLPLSFLAASQPPSCQLILSHDSWILPLFQCSALTQAIMFPKRIQLRCASSDSHV